MHAVFDALGTAVERAWAAVGRDPVLLPPIAAAALSQLAAARIPDPIAGAAGYAIQAPLPRQLPVEFGDAQVTVWRGDDLLVQLIYWLDKTTAIHQHGFAGAFRVLCGASLHSTYELTAPRAFGPGFRLGTLRRVGQELLEPGGVREIGAGDRLIHNLVHVEMPSVTLTVRTPFRSELAPQWVHHLPGVSIDPEARDPELRARLRLHAVSARLTPARAIATARAIVELGLDASWQLLESIGGLSEPDRARYFALVERVHGGDGRLMVEAIRRKQAREALFSLRRNVTSRPHRLLLALLGDAGDRDTILSAIARLYPGASATARLERWLLELAGPLGIGLDASSARVLRRAIEGIAPAEIVAELRARGLARFSPRTVGELAAAFAASPMFEALFTPGSLASRAPKPNAAPSRRKSTNKRRAPT